MDHQNACSMSSSLITKIDAALGNSHGGSMRVNATHMHVVNQAPKGILRGACPFAIPDGHSNTTRNSQCHNEQLKVLQRTFTNATDGGLRLAYPTSSDWEIRKDEIMLLYLSENRTLEQTRQIMIGRGFKASMKMYKTQFKRWEFTKYNRGNKVFKTDCTRNQRQVRVDMHRFPEIRRPHIEMEARACDGGWTGHFTPLSNVVTFTTTAPERYLHYIQDYIRGTSASGTWSKMWSLNATSYAKNFYLVDLALTAKNAFMHGYGEEAFQIIDLAFSQLKSCMKSQIVDLLTGIHWVGLVYYSFSREIAVSWFKHSIDLSRIIYASGQYPQYQTAWIEQMGRMDIDQWTHVSVRAIDFNMRALCKRLTIDGRPKSDFVRWTTNLMWRARGMGQAIAPSGDIANVGRLTWEGSGWSDLDEPYTKLALAGVLFDEGNYGEAKQIADNILKIKGDGNREVRGFCFRILFLIATKTGNTDDARFWARKSSSFWTTYLDDQNELTVDTLHGMQEGLRSRGNVSTARACQKHIRRILDQRCERLQQEIGPS